MLPRLRFVVASLAIALLPMVFLGAGLAPTAHTSPAELSRADRPVVLGPAQYSEAQYRSDRQALSYARRATELNKLREMANAPLANWMAAPAGAEPTSPSDAGASKVATVTTEGPSVVTVSTVTAPNPEKADVTVSVTVSPVDKRPPEVTIEAPSTEAKPAVVAPSEKLAEARPEVTADKPVAPPLHAAATSASDAPRASAPAAAPGRTYAALNPAMPKAETSKLPQMNVVMHRSKPRARVTRRAKPAAPLPQVAQKPPPFFELFAWLFNMKPQPTQGQGQAVQTPVQPAATLQRPQARSSFTPPGPTAFQTAAQP